MAMMGPRPTHMIPMFVMALHSFGRGPAMLLETRYLML